jgi:hypothetical protein
MKKHIRTAGGYSLIAVGIIGIFVPIMPTVPFLLAAAFLLGWEHRAIKPWASYLEKFKIAKRPGGAQESVSAGESSVTGIPVEPATPPTPSGAFRALRQRE